MPKSLWAEAVNHATQLKNRSPTKAIPGKTPYEAVNRSKPNLENLHQFRCSVFVKRTHSPKLEPKAKEARFVRYHSYSKGYHIFWQKKKKVPVKQEVMFKPEEQDLPGNVMLEGENLENNHSTTRTIENKTKQEKDSPNTTATSSSHILCSKPNEMKMAK